MDIITASQIAATPSFMARIEFLMVKAAVAKLNATTPPSADILLGQRILNGEEPVTQWALATIGNATIMAGAHDPALGGSSIVDGDLEFTVNSLWAAFSL